jgi:hypothetical protein
MAWSKGGERPQEIKFLVDLERHTYISDKSHQEMINQAGLNPAGYDNFLKGWVRRDGTIKLWVETIEDVVFRYWDQIKLAFGHLMKEKITTYDARTYAIVNRVERFAGKVQDFMRTRSKNTFFENQLGYVVHFYGQPKVASGSEVMLLVNYKLAANRYLVAGTRGRIVTASGRQAKRLRVRWSGTINGYHKARGGTEILIDRRLLTLV